MLQLRLYKIAGCCRRYSNEIESMKKAFLVILSCLLSSSAIADAKSDITIAKALLGAWEWSKTYNDCTEDGAVAFKSNGTYTITTEDCSMADDGFGYFHYGWFVANNYICFVYDERQSGEVKPTKKELELFLKNKRREGFNKENCHWEVLSYTSKYITLKNSWGGKAKSVEEIFTLKKSSWLNK